MEQQMIQRQKRQREEMFKQLVKMIDQKVFMRIQNDIQYAFFQIQHYHRDNRKRFNSVETIQISPLNLREQAHKLSNYNLIQQEIFKKEKLSRLVSILSVRAYKTISSCLVKIQHYKKHNIMRQIKNLLLYKQNKIPQLEIILHKFYQNRHQQQIVYNQKQQVISTFIQRIQILKFKAFYKWMKNIGLQNVKRKPQVTFKKVLPRALFSLLKAHIYSNFEFFFLRIRARQTNINILDPVYRNMILVSQKLNSQLNKANFKNMKKRRQLLLVKFLMRLSNNNQMIIYKNFCKWRKKLKKNQFSQRLRLIHLNNQLEDDQKLLIQQYKQLQDENFSLQNSYQPIQTYYNTPNGLSVKKSEMRQQQEPIPEEDQYSAEEYSLQYIDNLESINMELRQKKDEQTAMRQRFLAEYEQKRLDLLQKIQEKSQFNKQF
ncbi:hypothetical protein pb186bvf_011240 [Paramecium bursaria]